MAHAISIQNGRPEIAYYGHTPWHGLGVRVDSLQTPGGMLRHAGLEWSVQAEPVACAGADIPGYRAIVRQDTRKVLGVVTSRYHCIQNSQAAEMMNAVVTVGGAHVEVAGALDDGARCWMLAHVPGDFEVVRGDAVRPYALLAWGHNGKLGLAMKLTTVRVVCKNTLNAAGFGGRVSRVADVYVKHTSTASVNLEEARRALGLVAKQVEVTAEAYRSLARTMMSDDRVAEYFTEVFPEPPWTTVDSDPMAFTRWQARQESLAQLYHAGVGADMPGVHGTAWGAYNAVTEYVDHVYPMLSSGDVSRSRLQSVAFGAFADVKTRAFALAGSRPRK